MCVTFQKKYNTRGGRKFIWDRSMLSAQIYKNVDRFALSQRILIKGYYCTGRSSVINELKNENYYRRHKEKRASKQYTKATFYLKKTRTFPLERPAN